MRDSEPRLDVGDSVPVAIDAETTSIFERAPVSPVTPSLASTYGASFASSYAAPFEAASYEALPALSCDEDDDEPPRLPPPPARGSQTYAVPSVARERPAAAPVALRLRARSTNTPTVLPDGSQRHASRALPVPARRPQSETPVDDEAMYQAVLRHFR